MDPKHLRFDWTRRPGLKWGLLYVLLTVLLLAVYWPSLRGGFIWDDHDNITGNASIRSFDGLGKIWGQPGATMNYYPLFYTSFWLDHQMWQGRPLPYRLQNLLLQAACALLLMILLEQLRVPGALWAGLLFAVHPICVESVAWITERKNLLSLLFYLASALSYVRFAGLGNEPSDARMQRKGAYLAALGFFVLALLSKTMVVTLPAALMVLLWWKRRLGDRLLWLSLVPFFCLSALAAEVTIWMESHQLGARGEDYEFGWIGHLIIAGKVVWFYLFKTLWPGEQMFMYPRWQIVEDPWNLVWPLSFGLLLLGCLLACKKIGRGVFVALALYAGTLFPVMWFFGGYMIRFSFVGDHLCYQALPALFALAGAALAQLPGPGLARTVPLLLVGIFSWLSFHVAGEFLSDESVWRDTLEKNDASWIAHHNLAGILRARGEISQARFHYRTAVIYNPKLAEAYGNLGSMAAEEGHLGRAKSQYLLGLRSNWPNGKIQYNLGNLYLQEGKPQMALIHFRNAVEIDPSFAAGHAGLAYALTQAGDRASAIGPYLRAIQLSPKTPAYYRNLAVVFWETRQHPQTRAVLEEGLRQIPGEPTLRDMLGRLPAATHQPR
ncbi:MAG: tetratricopeptide repeat protein [Verrucomicrobiae bacterium]|nr:tetratricopeptide repeat protein [Verrucomicrobiae bacterium]